MDWRNTESIWKATLETDPGSFRAWAHLGQFYGKGGRNREAFECFKKAAGLNPYIESYSVNEIEYCIRTAMEEKDAGLLYYALSQARRTVSRFPWNVWPRIKLAKCLITISSLEGDSRDALLGSEAAISSLTFIKPELNVCNVWLSAVAVSRDKKYLPQCKRFISRILKGE